MTGLSPAVGRLVLLPLVCRPPVLLFPGALLAFLSLLDDIGGGHLPPFGNPRVSPRWRLRRWSHLAVATRPRFLRRAPRPPPVNTWHMLLSPEAGALPPAPGPAPTPESRASFGSTRSDRLDFTTSCPSIARRQEGRFLGQPVSWITSQSARVCQPGPVLQHA